jgi:DNA-binding response OmpR family regulator
MVDETIAQLEPETADTSRSWTVLIVDDDESQVAALEYRLQKQGYRVLTAFTGEAARNAALDEPPDVVLLDLRLPDLDGFELCSQLADAPQTCGIPIIILSAMERPDIVRQSRAAGGAYYVRKPYDPNVLLTLIQDSLGQATSLDW